MVLGSGVGSIPSRAPPLERHDKGSGLDYTCSISAIPALGAKNIQHQVVVTK